jgi:N-acetylglucosaminyldiphosphoundecaprenol N-acetyl-beta-D-mannosaminyltransferase
MITSGHASAPATPVPTRHLFGVPIAAVTLAEVVALVDEAIAWGRRLHIGVVNAAKLVNMRRDPELARDVASSDLVLADGMAVVWASRILGAPLPERTAGIDLMFAILESANRHAYRVYCLGATREVLDRTVAAFRRDYPRAQIVGAQDGYFSADDEGRVAAAISAAQPDILFVGMSSPRKEAFLARWSSQLGVPICHGVGGSFDVAAGMVQRAPQLWQRAGLEWLYRVKQEPRRLWRRYLVTNTLFVEMVVIELARRLFGAPNQTLDVP